MVDTTHMPVSLDDLKHDATNPRTITPNAAKGLGKSLHDFGDLSGIVWNKQTGELVAGHQRIDQLKKLGAVLEGEWIVVPSTGERFRVRVVDWSKRRQRAANVIANNPEIAGEFTIDVMSYLTDARAELGDDDFKALSLESLEYREAHKKRRDWSARTDAKANIQEEFLGMPEWLRSRWDAADDLIVQYSGGKDSTGAVIFAATHKQPHQKLKLVFSDPGVEFPGISAHVVDVAEHFSAEPIIVRCETDWWQWLRKMNTWPSLIFRPCATKFVHEPFAKLVKQHEPAKTILMTGSRGTEAVAGSEKTERSALQSLGDKREEYQHFAPVFFVEKVTIEQAIAAHNVPVWEGYSRGFVRTACWCCPGQCGQQAATLAREYPGLVNDILRWEKRIGIMRPQSTPPIGFDDILRAGEKKTKNATRE